MNLVDFLIILIHSSIFLPTFFVLKCLIQATDQYNFSPKVNIAPGMADGNRNMSVIEGNEAIMKCLIKGVLKEGQKVAWFRVDTQTVISFQYTLVTRDPRFNVSSSYDGTDWKLKINPVTINDKGHYMCQINSNPPFRSSIHLDILTPPKIEDDTQTPKSIYNEHTSVNLSCRATGNPTPNISWGKLMPTPNQLVPIIKSQAISRPKLINLNTTKQWLTFPNLTRYQAGIYVCLAENGVIPSVSRHYYIRVNYAPRIINYTLSDEVFGHQVFNLTCVIDGYPNPKIIWYKGKMRIRPRTHKQYKIINLRINESTIISQLRVNTTSPLTFGKYRCIAKNAYGKSKQTMHLKSETLHNYLSQTTILDQMHYTEHSNVIDNSVDYSPTPSNFSFNSINSVLPYSHLVTSSSGGNDKSEAFRFKYILFVIIYYLKFSI